MSPLIIVLISLLLSAFFSGMEIAFISSNRLKIELDKKHGNIASRIISFFMKSPGHYIATMLVGNNIALVIYGTVVAQMLEPIIEGKFGIHNEVFILSTQTILGTLVILFTAEFLPKTLFRSRPNSALNIFAIPVAFLYILLYPITIIAIGITNFIMRVFLGIDVQMRAENNNPVFGKIDLDYLVNEGQSDLEASLDDEPEKKIFLNALEFSSLKVRDCMVPRTEVEALELNSTLNELKQICISTGFSKILIYEKSIDNIIGYIRAKELFDQPDTIKSRLVPLLIVPETMNVNKLFSKLIKEHKNIALVVDEYGGTSGIITLEDIIEEIFGEIEDEHDTIELKERQINENEYVFSGRLEIDYINDNYNIELPESEGYETLAGYIIDHCENIPKLNNRIIIGAYQFRMLKVSQTKIELVQVKKMEG
ncbi:MAG: hemolysin family protein [Bacteroidales bacterium]|nr:hemolysin family protein [Bacteroidales bacterium]MCF8390844.1 hemolysin family protein [Bacteroidales bacterium]